MTLKIGWPQALAWRMRRQLLDPIGRSSVADVVRRLSGVQTQVASSAELGICLRRDGSGVGEVGAALADGALIKTWAMRGTLHLLTPEDGGAVLSLLAAGRSWERPSWQRYFGLDARAMEALRETVREALDGAVLTREELIAAVIRRPGLEHVGEGLRSGWGTVLKPLAWHGDLCFGPAAGNRVTFMRPEAASSRWAGIPDPADAARIAIEAYLGAYGPATVEGFSNWLSRGRVPKRQLQSWFGALGHRLTGVEVGGEELYVLSEHLEELAATRPSRAVRLLPGFDQYVLGPGTEDPHVVASARRWEVSRQSGWIAPVVVIGGVVNGTWALDGNLVRIAWFAESGAVPKAALGDEVKRLGAILGRDLAPSISRLAMARKGPGATRPRPAP